MAQFLDKNGTQILANKIKAVKTVADGAKTTANNAMPKSGGTFTGDITAPDVYATHQFIIPATNTNSRGCGIYETKDTINLFGYLSADINHATLNVGATGKKLSFRGNATRPLYSTSSIANKELALLTDVNTKYTKPSGGIPKTDLASDVQASLGKADSAYDSLSNYYTKMQTNSAINAAIKNAITTVLNTPV